MSSGRKPLDIGNGVVCASFGLDCSWLSLGGAHSEQGFVELNALPAFDEAWRGDPEATRRFRGWMTEERFAVLRLALPGDVSTSVADPRRPRWTLSSPVCRDEIEAWADARGCVQRHRLSARGASPPSEVRLQFAGRLDRPALAEITEVNPPSPTGAVTVLAAAGSVLRITADALPATVVLAVHVEPQQSCVWRVTASHAELAMLWAGRELTVEIAARLEGTGSCAAPTDEPVETSPEDLPRIGPPRTLIVPARFRRGVEGITRRALAYVRGCTALIVAPDERAILTDHRLLPLSWTRDAYYQALLLLSTGSAADAERVASHLRWLWLRNERPDGRWMRSHHANGRRKDLVVQLDQQLYPMVELADYWRAVGSLPRASADWSALVSSAWQAAMQDVDPITGLAATSETSADDPAALPYVLAAQVLLWYTARRLGELAERAVLSLDAVALAEVAALTRRAVFEHLADAGGWAYATDGRGGRERYHDANDLPTVLAPLWGFCSAADPAWRTTMRRGLSPSHPGYADGPLGGLGSIHTPGAWPLGEIQAWLFASLTGAGDEGAASTKRLVNMAQEDGMLPEACDPLTGQTLARHWFAWPGAVLGALVLLDGRGLLEQRLRATA